MPITIDSMPCAKSRVIERSTIAVPPISTEDRKTRLLGWIVTLIPRVGVVRPF